MFYAYMSVQSTGGFVIQIVIFAMVAVFLGFRLYAVLGKRTGHEQPLTQGRDDGLRGTNPIIVVEDGGDAPPSGTDDYQTPGAQTGLRMIGSADRSFNAADFIDGAKSAYRIILEAFWAGKEEEYSAFVSDEVKTAFASAIADRTSQGHVLDNRLISIERAVISDAAITDGIASITVTFDADVAAITRDMDGGVIAGSLTDAVTTHDAWTFSRNVKSSDPNWILTDTDEAA